MSSDGPRLDGPEAPIDHRYMWGIILTNDAGEEVDRVTVEAPFEAMRDWCRRVLEARPDASRARLLSTDGSFDYAYPETDRDA